MAEGQEGAAGAAEPSKHEQMMAKFHELELTLNEAGVPSFSTNQARLLYAYGLVHTKQAPAHLKTWQEVASGLELIQGMGMPAIANLRYVYFVGGHLTAMHKLCLAACQATGELERYEVIALNDKNERESEENLIGFRAAGCVVYAQRRGYDKAAMGTFTVEEAQQAGMAGRNPTWKSYAKDMLWHRASIRALYKQFSDVLQGVRCKEDEEMHLMKDAEGQALVAADGRQIYQKRLAQKQHASENFEALKEA